MTGLPVIASGWSGHLDFLDTEKSLLIGGDIIQVPAGQAWKDIILPQSKWFKVNDNQAYKCFNYCFDKVEEIKTKGRQLMDKNHEKFTLNKMTEKLDEMMEKHTKNVSFQQPSQVQLKLPKLNKTNNKSEPPKIKLPKLKKVTSEVTV